MVVALLVKLHLLASLLKMVDVHGRGFFILLLYIHKTAYGCVDIGVADF